MTPAEVEQIVDRKLSFYSDTIRHFLDENPTMTTKEVAKFLGMSKEWVQKHKEQLGGKRANRRGDLRFRTDTILDYKLNKMQL